jgi:phosphoribosyl-AMP cyclohydrolase
VKVGISNSGGLSWTLGPQPKSFCFEVCPVSSSPAPDPINAVEEGLVLRPKFDANGLVTCVTTDVASGDVLMVAHMNEEALRKTIESREAWYFSRSRGRLWRKGESSGHVQHVVELRVDCDQDAVWLRVEQQGAAACHTGRRSCFYRAAVLGEGKAGALTFAGADRIFDPEQVYGKS